MGGSVIVHRDPCGRRWAGWAVHDVALGGGLAPRRRRGLRTGRRIVRRDGGGADSFGAVAARRAVALTLVKPLGDAVRLEVSARRAMHGRVTPMHFGRSTGRPVQAPIRAAGLFASGNGMMTKAPVWRRVARMMSERRRLVLAEPRISVLRRRGAGKMRDKGGRSERGIVAMAAVVSRGGGLGSGEFGHAIAPVARASVPVGDWTVAAPEGSKSALRDAIAGEGADGAGRRTTRVGGGGSEMVSSARLATRVPDQLGRWIGDIFADEARRPPSGVTGFDSGLAPIFPGRKPGF